MDDTDLRLKIMAKTCGSFGSVYEESQIDLARKMYEFVAPNPASLFSLFAKKIFAIAVVVMMKLIIVLIVVSVIVRLLK